MLLSTNEMVTFNCPYCHKDQLRKLSSKKKVFCNTLCQYKNKKFTISLCSNCKKEFTHNKNHQAVCPNCTNIIPEESRQVQGKCLCCSRDFYYKKTAENQKRNYCSLHCFHFNTPTTLPILEKKNKEFWNLISTFSSYRTIPKPWGMEFHVTNNIHYCLKYLVFYDDCLFSNHYHKMKHETWHCLVGGFEVVLTQEEQKSHLLLKEGDSLEIAPKIIHQIRSLAPSILTEVSTQDFPEDSIRLSLGMMLT